MLTLDFFKKKLRLFNWGGVLFKYQILTIGEVPPSLINYG